MAFRKLFNRGSNEKADASSKHKQNLSGSSSSAPVTSPTSVPAQPDVNTVIVPGLTTLSSS